MTQRIIAIEDEKDIVELLGYTLRREGFELKAFERGRDGFEALLRGPADLALIDIMLPDLDGLEICKLMRADERLKHLPVIFLTAKAEEFDRILGLEIGADDYIVKPFSPREVVARIKAVLRRREAGEHEPRIIEIQELRLDPATHDAVVRGRRVTLSSLEFKLLHFLASHPRRIFPRESLLDRVWGPDRFVTPRTVDVHIRRLREKIELHPERPRYLQTVRGAGYRFAEEQRDPEA